MNTQLQIDPHVIDSAQSLEWIARTLAKGHFLGKHFSPRTGTGMEFSHYRSYTQGDDIRLLDWKMYAKTGKYYIRQSNIEVEQTLSIHIDNSPSMDYREDHFSKIELAKLLSAVLSYIVMRQADRFCWESMDVRFPISHGMKQWRHSLVALHKMTTTSDIRAFEFVHQGVHLLVSDLYLATEKIEKIINNFIGANKELVIFHIMGEREEKLDFSSNTKFVDLETSEELQVDASRYAAQYRETLFDHFNNVKKLCHKKGIILEKIYLQSNIPDTIRSFVTQYNYLSAL